MGNNVSTRSKSKPLRILAIAVLVFIAAIIIFTLAVFPRMQNFFLKKGLDYARLKMLAVLPTAEGFNPDINPVDPMMVNMSLMGFEQALDIKALATKNLQNQMAHFLTVFKNNYEDQLLTPTEIENIAATLDTVQINFLRQNFLPMQLKLEKLFEAKKDSHADLYHEILGFDSIAIQSEKIKLGLTAPASIELVDAYYSANSDGNIDQAEYDTIVGKIHLIERFQIRNDLQGAVTFIYEKEEFKKFPDAQKFKDDVNLVLKTLRDLNFNYMAIKPTLRSFIFQFYQTSGSIRQPEFDLKPLYEFVKYAADYIRKLEASLKQPESADSTK